jgi:D-3-phosphoglycerate dehydrogenase
MLYITNADKPGVVGAIGTTTAASGINIAKMHLGRDSHGGRAIVLLEIDEAPNDDHLEELRDLPNIYDVRYLQFPTL